MVEAEIKKALIKLIEEVSPHHDCVCSVTSVNLTDLTCLCEPINGDADIVDVRLITDESKGFVIIPPVGSKVTVSFLNDSTAYVSQFSTVSEIRLNGTNYDGLVKINDLVTKLNNLETRVNLIVTDLAALATAMNALGAVPVLGTVLGAAITTAIANAITPLTPTIKANLENTTVKHGNGK